MKSEADKNSKQIKEIIKQVESNRNTIEQPEIPFNEMESGIGKDNNNQMYFKNIEVLYNHLSINQVSEIKSKIQAFVHAAIDKSLRECTIDANDIMISEQSIVFKVTMKDFRFLSVTVKINIDKSLDISIIPGG